MRHIQITGTKAQGIYGNFEEIKDSLFKLCNGNRPVAIDIETSPTEEYDPKTKAPKPGLFPPKSNIELIQFSDGETTIVTRWKPKLILHVEQVKELAAHSAKFEIKHLKHKCRGLLNINCTEMLARLVDASHYSADAWALMNHKYRTDTAYKDMQQCIIEKQWDKLQSIDGFLHRPGHTLGSCIERFLNVKIPKDQAASDWSGELSDEQLSYAAADAYYTAKLYQVLRDYVEKLRCGDVYKLYCKTLRVCADMELEGFPVNKEILEDQISQWKKVRGKHEKNLMFYFEDVNLRSPKQMGEWFTENYPDKVGTWPRTEPSKANPEGNLTFNSQALQLAEGIPAFEELLKFRKVDKLLSTYGEGLLEGLVESIARGNNKRMYSSLLQPELAWEQLSAGEWMASHYRIHSSFRIGSTTTGRMSSCAPNLQNLPRDEREENMITTIPNRHIFQPVEHRSFVAADYSQIELRVAATVSDDKYMLQCYNEGVDLHKAIVSELVGKPIEAVNKSERQLGKAVNFGLLYGMGPSKLKGYAKLSYGADMEASDAQKFYEHFHKLYRGYSKWCDKIRERTVQTGYVRTPMGRLRKLTETEHYTRCVNTIVQGGAAEVVMLALVYCHKALKQYGRLVNVVHDEIIIECEDKYTAQCKEILSECMTRAYQKIFPEGPLRDLIEVNVGKSWSEVK